MKTTLDERLAEADGRLSVTYSALLASDLPNAVVADLRSGVECARDLLRDLAAERERLAAFHAYALDTLSRASAANMDVAADCVLQEALEIAALAEPSDD